MRDAPSSSLLLLPQEGDWREVVPSPLSFREKVSDPWLTSFQGHTRPLERWRQALPLCRAKANGTAPGSSFPLKRGEGEGTLLSAKGQSHGQSRRRACLPLSLEVRVKPCCVGEGLPLS